MCFTTYCVALRHLVILISCSRPEYLSWYSKLDRSKVHNQFSGKVFTSGWCFQFRIITAGWLRLSHEEQINKDRPRYRALSTKCTQNNGAKLVTFSIGNRKSVILFTYDLLKAFSQASNTRKKSITQGDANATELKQTMEVKAITRIKSKLSKGTQEGRNVFTHQGLCVATAPLQYQVMLQQSLLNPRWLQCTVLKLDIMVAEELFLLCFSITVLLWHVGKNSFILKNW